MSTWLDALPDGEMSTRLRETDWSATAVGPIDDWPETLRATVSLVMSSRFPMLVVWGRELTQIYNDAFIVILAEKHPQIGCQVKDTWSEIFDLVGPMMYGVLDTGEATWAQDGLYFIDRRGFPEDTYFTFSYSPIMDSGGVAQGLLATAVETTEHIVDARRLKAAGEVGALQGTDVDSVARKAAATIARHPDDLPFALIHLREGEERHRLAGACGVPEDRAGSWPLEESGGELTIIDDVADRVGEVVHELSGRPVHQAAMVRLGMHGTLVVGLSPSRRIDDRYRAFLTLLGAQLEGVLAVAHAIQTEQARVDELLALDRAKSMFFANVSHELRTPVTLMLGPLADALMDARSPLTGEQRERIEAAHRNAGRLIALVDDVLDFTRENGKARRSAPMQMRIGAHTAELAAAFASAVEQAGLELVVVCPEPARPVWFDPHTWERIVLNLVSNAVKYTPSGTIAVRLLDLGDRVRLEVQDTGTGIPATELERVFERFHRVPNEHARSAEGAGIGLSLVRRLVELEGGEIGVESVVGEGSTFWVEFRLRDPEFRGDGPPESVRPVVDRAPLAGAARVLVADDNADMRAYVTRVLTPEFAVRAEADGAAALRAALEDPPDLVLTDVMMPVLDGFSLLKELRGDPATAAIPVVMLSARAGSEAIVEGLDAGADEYLLKPFSSAELVARVRSTIELTRARGALVQAVAQHESDGRLLRAEERFRHAGEAARVGTWSLHLTSGQTELDANLEEMFGVARGTLTTLAACLDLVVPQERARVEAELALASTERDETIHEFRIQRPDGQRRVFQWRASANRDEHGRPATLYGACWDATALADAQAAIRESEQAAPAGIAIVEHNGLVSRANRALGELLGRPVEELAGRPFAALVHPDDDAEVVMGANAMKARELRLIDAHGDPIWATVSSAPVRGADGAARHVVVHIQDARERKRFEHELQHLAEHDALTDLWNRRRFGDEVERALADAQRYGLCGALLLIDVDGLKHVNDTLGHVVGDELLIAVADVLRDRLRQNDVPARLGGDEFAVLLPRAGEAAARTVASDLLTDIRRSSPLASSAGAGTITACAGIALFGGPSEVTGGEELLIEADAALYEAKDAGRGQLRVRYADAAAESPAPRRPRWSARIRAALDDGRFVLHAQPIVALQGDPLERWELLLRMLSENGELLAPPTFLPTAERSPLILEIDHWVVHAAIRELAARRDAGQDCAFAVNLSAKSIIDPGMGRYVLDEIDAAGVDGSRLVFEVTETSAIMSVERARGFVDTIAQRGCALALDDFGAGFTSFHYLKHLEFAYLKIDGAFITDLMTDLTNQSLVRALSTMARSLGKRTVAECVSDDATVEWLRELGVNYAQGFHLGRPRAL